MPTNGNYQYSLLTFIGWHGNDKENQFLLEFFIVSSFVFIKNNRMFVLKKPFREKKKIFRVV